MIIGIDPGFTGAIAFLDKGNHVFVADLPLKLFMGRKQIDAKKLTAMILDMLHRIDANKVIAVVEDVGPRPKQGVVSTFRFGYNAGILLGVLEALGVNVLRVKPAVWKSALNLSQDKKKSLALAKKTFPLYKHYFQRAKDDGRAEAALLAHFAQETF